MVKHLMDRHGLDVIAKLNPTLLGFGRVVEVLQQDLAYEHIRLNRLSFVEDLEIGRAVDLISDLARLCGGQRAQIRGQAHQHDGGQQRQGTSSPTTRCTCPVRRSTCWPPACSTTCSSTMPGTFKVAGPRRSGAGELLSRREQGQRERHGRDGRRPGDPVLRPVASGWLWATGADDPPAGAGHGCGRGRHACRMAPAQLGQCEGCRVPRVRPRPT